MSKRGSILNKGKTEHEVLTNFNQNLKDTNIEDLGDQIYKRGIDSKYDTDDSNFDNLLEEMDVINKDIDKNHYPQLKKDWDNDNSICKDIFEEFDNTNKNHMSLKPLSKNKEKINSNNKDQITQINENRTENCSDKKHKINESNKIGNLFKESESKSVNNKNLDKENIYDEVDHNIKMKNKHLLDNWLESNSIDIDNIPLHQITQNFDPKSIIADFEESSGQKIPKELLE